jgi:hypothetical protein
MLISIRHRFVFLAMPKCASTAIEAALRPYASLVFSGTQFKHSTLEDYKQFIEPLLKAKHVDTNAIEILALIREPSDWIESWWRYRSRPELADPNHPMHKNYTGGITLDGFVEAYVSRKPPPFARIGSQAKRLVGTAGDSSGLTLFRYEDINSFIEYVEGKINKKLSVPKLNVSPASVQKMSEPTLTELRSAIPADFEIYESIASSKNLN